MLLTPSISHFVVLLFSALIVFAAYGDIRDYKIPNRLSLSVALLYPAYVLAAPAPVDWLMALTYGLTTLVLGFLMFSRGWLGGGDAKLMSAIMIWAGPQDALMFVFVTTVAGGLLAVAIWLKGRYGPVTSPPAVLASSSDSGLSKRPVPYAVAIACGGLYVAFTLLGVGLPRLPL